MFSGLFIVTGLIIWLVNFQGRLVDEYNQDILTGKAPKVQRIVSKTNNNNYKTTSKSKSPDELNVSEFSTVQSGANFKRRDPSSFIKK